MAFSNRYISISFFIFITATPLYSFFKDIYTVYIYLDFYTKTIDSFQLAIFCLFPQDILF